MLLTGIDRFTLDLTFHTTTLPAPAAYRPLYSEGLLSRLGAVVDEYREYRNVRPLRIVMTGPPMAGRLVGIGWGGWSVGAPPRKSDAGQDRYFFPHGLD